MLRIADLLPELGPDLVNVDWIVAQKYLLLLVDADHHSLFGDLFHGSGLRNRDLNAGLQYRRRHHKDDEQHQHHVYERSDVDVGESNLCAPVRGSERHYRRTSSATLEAMGCRSTAFSISKEKSSHRAAKSRIEPPIRLYAITAGMATTNPPAVVMSASEIPGATARSVAAPLVPSP